MPKKYRTKPIVIEALQWDGDNTVDVLHFTGNRGLLTEVPDAILEKGEVKPVGEVQLMIAILTLEGRVYASKGDYIIKGIQGELYPCKPDIFAASYELVEE